MKPAKCDRCGIHTPKQTDRFFLKIRYGNELIHIYRVCENCYQTIKEVLEDGEIK